MPESNPFSSHMTKKLNYSSGLSYTFASPYIKQILNWYLEEHLLSNKGKSARPNSGLFSTSNSEGRFVELRDLSVGET